MKIPFKVIATDMDGTFYSKDGDYDHQKFAQIMPRLLKANLHFVIATGNELLRTQKSMGLFAKQCDYVLENGSLVMVNNQVIYQSPLTTAVKNRTLNFLKQNYPQVSIVLSGLKNAYIDKKAEFNFKKMIFNSYSQVVEVDNLLAIQDPIYKITLNASEKIVQMIVTQLNQNAENHVRAVTGGGPWMDIINPQVNKALGLKKLLAYLHLDANELIAFGDGNNDLEMLQLAKYSYAMDNSNPQVKKAAHFVAPKNTENGVLQVLQRYLDGEGK